MIGSSLAVGRLRLRTDAAGVPALRLRAERALQAADLTPPGLPPSALLVVRRLVDPLPGRFGGGHLRPRGEWERAVRSALASLARVAVRPDGSGRLPANAEAVIFADEAEAIACLVAELARGCAEEKWWWRSVRRRLHLPPPLVTAGTRDPSPLLAARVRELPAVLATIARWGAASEVARAIGVRDAAALIDLLAREHALPAIVAEAAGAYRRQDVAGAAATGGEFGPSPMLAAQQLERAVAGWRVPCLDVPAPHRVVGSLFAVALGVWSAPARLRAELASASREIEVARRAAVARNDSGRALSSASPVHAGEAGEAAAETEAPRAVVPAAETGVSSASAGDHSQGRVDSIEREHVSAPVAGATIEPRVPSHESVEARINPTGVLEPRAAVPMGTDAARVAGGPAANQPGTSDSSLDETPRVVPQEPEPPADVSTFTSRHPGEPVPTQLGGLFCLIHALEDLGLPDGFEAGWELASTAGPWGTLDLVARALLGDRLAQYEHDPIWSLLAELTAWPTSHGRGVDPPFRAPAGWLERLGDEDARFQWAASDGRLWIWSRAGYLVAHRACSRPDADAARRELARLHLAGHRQVRLHRGSPEAIPLMPPAALPGGCPPRLGRLVSALAPAVARRIRLALGVDRPRRGRRHSLATLMATPAHVHVTSSHIDVVMPLDRVDLAARRAGLDRDPGWLPAWGRVIYFHFE